MDSNITFNGEIISYTDDIVLFSKALDDCELRSKGQMDLKNIDTCLHINCLSQNIDKSRNVFFPLQKNRQF